MGCIALDPKRQITGQKLEAGVIMKSQLVHEWGNDMIHIEVAK